MEIYKLKENQMFPRKLSVCLTVKDEAPGLCCGSHQN